MRPPLKTARPLARLRNGRADWYRIENHAPTQTATVMIYDEIGYFGVTAADFCRDLNALTAKNINLRVNSPGGEIFDGIAIYNGLRNHPAKVTATVDGLAASAASFIVMAADEIVAEPSATLMIHDGIGLCMGNAEDMAAQADLLNQLSTTIADIYAAKTGRSSEEMRALMKAETWFTAQEAVDAGLVDRIAGSADGDGSDDEGAGESTTDPEDAKAAKAPANTWDLSIFTYPGRDAAPAPVIPTPAATAAPAVPAWSFDSAAFRNAIREAVR